jgi:hypothetical protein
VAQDTSALKHLDNWPLTIVFCLLLLLLRAWFFAAWEESYFNSDQAIVGLMAKHLAEGRARPLFIYGQEYMLAVESWVAAPAIALAGGSVATLRAALIVLNGVTGVLLLRLLVKDAGLERWSAALASMPFWLAPVPTAASLVEAGGGNIEPFLWVLILWMLRRHPLWLGLFFGFAFLNREYTVYALPPLMLVQIAEHGRVDRQLVASWLTSVLGCVLVFQAVAMVKPFADIYGPGSAAVGPPIEESPIPSSVLDRVTWRPDIAGPQLIGMVTDYLPRLLGLTNVTPAAFGIGSPVAVGWPALIVPLTVTLVVVMAGLAIDCWRTRAQFRALFFPGYLFTVGVTAAVVYAAFRTVSIDTTRYALLFLFAPIGIAAAALQPARALAIRTMAAVALTLLASGAAIDHARMIAAARASPVAGRMRAIADRLQAEGVTVAWSSYWYAYAITFLSNETTKVASLDHSRIAEYVRLAIEAEAATNGVPTIREQPCAGGEKVADVYICRR